MGGIRSRGTACRGGSIQSRPNHGEPSAASLAGREESSSGHHAAGHLLHTSLLAPLVLEPDLKEGNNLSAVDGIKLFYKEI